MLVCAPLILTRQSNYELSLWFMIFIKIPFLVLFCHRGHCDRRHRHCRHHAAMLVSCCFCVFQLDVSGRSIQPPSQTVHVSTKSMSYMLTTLQAPHPIPNSIWFAKRNMNLLASPSGASSVQVTGSCVLVAKEPGKGGTVSHAMSMDEMACLWFGIIAGFRTSKLLFSRV